MGKVELLGVLELNFSNLEFRTRSMKLEAFWQNNTRKYTKNLFRMIISLQNMFITVQRFQVIWVFPFQRNFNFATVHSAENKHLSPDTDFVGVIKYLIINFCKAKS